MKDKRKFRLKANKNLLLQEIQKLKIKRFNDGMQIAIHSNYYCKGLKKICRHIRVVKRICPVYKPHYLSDILEENDKILDLKCTFQCRKRGGGETQHIFCIALYHVKNSQSGQVTPRCKFQFLPQVQQHTILQSAYTLCSTDKNYFFLMFQKLLTW